MCLDRSRPLRHLWQQIGYKVVSPGLRAPLVDQGDFDRMLRARASEMDRLVAQLAAGLIDNRDWADLFDTILLEGHTAAWVLGRQRGGIGGGEGLDDIIMGIAAKDNEADFLQGFLSDLDAGRYTDEGGNLKTKAVLNRQRLYLGKMRATASEAFVESGYSDTEYTWHLVAEDHCADCPEIAALSPFTKDTLFSHPGDGGTACLTNCLCFLEREDGVSAFERYMPPIQDDE